jgi:hypothetical protein
VRISMSRFRVVASLLVVVLASCSSWYEHPESGSVPPPLIGGTLIITNDGTQAVASDPARNVVITMNISTRELTVVQLQAGDEPGRLVQDGAGRIHVALRNGGAIATIDDGAVVERQEACAEPRGIAWQASTDQIHVACEGGELVTFAASGGPAVRTVRVERDLRDVMVINDHIAVTTFRSAEVITLDSLGQPLHRVTLPSVTRNVLDVDGSFIQVEAQPNVGYRATPLANGQIIMVHQRATGGPLGQLPTNTPGATYYAPAPECPGEGPVEGTVSIIPPDFSGPVRFPEVGDEKPAPRLMRRFPSGVVPVDVAASPVDGWIAVVTAGTGNVRLIGRSTLPDRSDLGEPCGQEPTDQVINRTHEGFGLPNAVAFTPEGWLVIQWDNVISVEPLGKPGMTNGYGILPEPYTVDSGRMLFNKITTSGLACASCHPEGREDAKVWRFASEGLRRTQMVSGHLAERAPYHWSADMPDLRTLTEEVMVKRMGSDELTPEQMFALTGWLGALRPLNPPTSLDPLAVARGSAIFDEVGCAMCHSGAIFTDNTRVDVGTGGSFKVPSLIGVGSRAPYLHDGCATTLRDRFGPCGGGQRHGGTDSLSEAELSDLMAFLESL